MLSMCHLHSPPIDPSHHHVSLLFNRKNAYWKLLLRKCQDRVYWRPCNEGVPRVMPDANWLRVIDKMQALCHCTDCRKISGGNYSNNHVIPTSNFKLVSGTPKKISKTADSGKQINSFFCGDCGSTLYRDGDGLPGMTVVKAGVLDDVKDIEKHIPDAELYGRQRVSWVKEVDGAEQKDQMGS